MFHAPAALDDVAEGSVPGLITLLRADAAATRVRRGRFGPFVYPDYVATAAYRLARFVRVRGAVATARAISVIAHGLTGAELDPIAVVGPGFVIAHTHGVVLGQGVRAGRDLYLHGGAVLGSTSAGFPTLGDDVTVFAKASVIGPIHVGDRAVVGAHALVLDDVPPDSTARGLPAVSFPRAPRQPDG
ncbi:MAG: serine O-acetyltransferase [Solirubrobacteraceae bacterium]|nr:serine O-acetyltransferase [Solirubrobacteraceae bacterium]